MRGITPVQRRRTGHPRQGPQLGAPSCLFGRALPPSLQFTAKEKLLGLYPCRQSADGEKYLKFCQDGARGPPAMASATPNGRRGDGQARRREPYTAAPATGVTLLLISSIKDAAMFLRLADGVQETMAQSRWPVEHAYARSAENLLLRRRLLCTQVVCEVSAHVVGLVERWRW